MDEGLRRRRAVEQARKLYAAFSGHDAEIVGSINKPVIPDALIVVGEIDFVGYTTTRDGQMEKYIHKFKAKARPLFCVSPDGSNIVFLGGEYNFTERGIVDKSG